jgi:hypothetical protein
VTYKLNSDDEITVTEGQPLDPDMAAKHGIDPEAKVVHDYGKKNVLTPAGKLVPSHVIDVEATGPFTEKELARHEQELATQDKRDKYLEKWQGILDSAPKASGTVYRGMLGVSPDDFKPGAEIEFKSDSSASNNAKVASQFSTRAATAESEQGYEPEVGDGVLLKIITKTAADITAFNPKESEVVIRKGTKLHVKGVLPMTVKNKWGTYRIVEMEEV